MNLFHEINDLTSRARTDFSHHFYSDFQTLGFYELGWGRLWNSAWVLRPFSSRTFSSLLFSID